MARPMQHAADVAQHAARLQRAEGDDLRHAVAAVALLHVIDDLVAPVLAEVDVEVGHRHPLGVEEALEQQPEPDRVEIGDGERVGDERARARAAPGPDRNLLRLCPLDEIGDDEEVAGVFHAFDHVELEGEALAVLLVGVALRDAEAREPELEPLLRALAQLRGLVDRGAARADREARQDRRLHPRPERATLRDLDRRGDRLGEIREPLGHLGAGLEPVLGRERLAVGLDHEPPLGDADQGVVRLVVLARREEGLVGGDERQAHPIGELDERGLGDAVGLAAVALQLDIEAVPEQPDERLAARAREISLAGDDRGVERAAGAAGERDQPVGLALEPGKLKMRPLVRRGLEEGARVEPHQAAIAARARGEEHDARRLRRRAVAPARLLIGEIDGERAAHDRLDAGMRHLVGELERAEHVVGVGERERRLPVGLGELGETGDGQRAFEQRIGRVHVQMDEAGHSRLAIP